MGRWWLLLLVGCAAESRAPYEAGPSPFHGDVTFPAEEREAVVAGIAWTSARLGVPARPVVWDLPHSDETMGGLSIMRVRRGSPLHLAGMSGHALTGTSFWIVDDAGPRVEVVAAHEVGHLLGCVHHEGAGLMTDGEAELAWTAADDAACPRPATSPSPGALAPPPRPAR